MNIGKELPESVDAKDRAYNFDFIRNAAMVCVIAYHSVAAYSTIAPWWAIHDGAFYLADLVREVLDVFMMPVFFFIAGCFFLPSLRKRGYGSFMLDKLKRLGAPWAILMLTIVPLLFFLPSRASAASQSCGFLGFWLRDYLGSIARPFFGATLPLQANQMHLWYISLLLIFFALAGAGFSLFGGKGARSSVPPEGRSISSLPFAMALVGLALLSSAATFAALLFAPDTSWFSLGILAQFQPTKVPAYALYFAFGIFAASRSRLRGSALLSRPLFWTALSAALTAAYLVAGRSVFARLFDSQLLPPLALLAYATARGLLSVALLGLLLSVSIKRFDRPMAANQRLSALSFEIYLVHFFPVIFFQGFLSGMEAIPAPVKAAIVFFAALPSSYLLGGAVKRFPRTFALGASALFALAALGLR